MKNLKKPLNSYARYTSIAMQMLVIIILGVWGGVLLDKYLGIKFPVFTVVLALGSVSLAIYVAVKDFLKKK
ncbi:MAG TPA: AtpZ/AtpI family protein [Bacteroidales bacterium]|nr:AtpZ/AtpI family protein [Bacteroidales bacterium]HQI69127.1 AtpZ/AtpI family protein [Bacteroidales bacterium]